MTTNAAQAQRGRSCSVCALPGEVRARVEAALAAGVALSRISRSMDVPSRDALRRHIQAGHLAPAVQEAVERLYGLDHVTVAARVIDGARRAREVSLEALETGDHATVLRAVETEMKTLSILASLGVNHEQDAELAQAFKDTSKAVFLAAQRDPAVAEAVGAELYELGRGDVAEDLLDQVPELREIRP